MLSSCFWLLLVGRESVSDTTGSVTVSWWLCLGPRLSLCRWNIHSATLVLGWDLGSGIWAGAAAASPKLGVALWVRCGVVCVCFFSFLRVYDMICGNRSLLLALRSFLRLLPCGDGRLWAWMDTGWRDGKGREKKTENGWWEMKVGEGWVGG